ncbi:MAG TPA: hypothetical protein VK028_04470 [Micromonosporaceae bacterium]|nr:hypothetical protein [Micromonosporaceae bacterium]
MLEWLRGQEVQDALLATNNFGDTRSGSLAGPTGLVIILLLAVATILLIRNMNKRLKRLPERFEPEKYERRRPGASAGQAASDRSRVDGQDSDTGSAADT